MPVKVGKIESWKLKNKVEVRKRVNNGGGESGKGQRRDKNQWGVFTSASIVFKLLHSISKWLRVTTVLSAGARKNFLVGVRAFPLVWSGFFFPIYPNWHWPPFFFLRTIVSQSTIPFLVALSNRVTTNGFASESRGHFFKILGFPACLPVETYYVYKDNGGTLHKEKQKKRKLRLVSSYSFSFEIAWASWS